MLQEVLYRRELVFESVVHTLGVVEEKPVHELFIEAVHVEEQCIVVVHEIFLDRPVEPLDVGIHLGSLRVRV